MIICFYISPGGHWRIGPVISLSILTQSKGVAVIRTTVSELARVVSMTPLGNTSQSTTWSEYFCSSWIVYLWSIWCYQWWSTWRPPGELMIIIVVTCLTNALHLGLTHVVRNCWFSRMTNIVAEPKQFIVKEIRQIFLSHQKFMQSGFSPWTSSNSVWGRSRTPQPTWLPSVPSGLNQVLGLIMLPGQ